MDIISSALDANHFAPDECLVSTFDAQEQLQQRSSRLDIWHFEPGKIGNMFVTGYIHLAPKWRDTLWQDTKPER